MNLLTVVNCGSRAPFRWAIPALGGTITQMSAFCDCVLVTPHWGLGSWAFFCDFHGLWFFPPFLLIYSSLFLQE
ncbi:hypothetical protein BDZ94DRAFT_1248907 [Collybia nuda]|uniref:Uncharacterized protein n=1 Tax=Collybia nuda TaxID=64659 RepID=A0A9P6CI67_9AGAR|nr:hypothetical protein BDZ94DRAFT_1248907 [Collybia nuda]